MKEFINKHLETIKIIALILLALSINVLAYFIATKMPEESSKGSYIVTLVGGSIGGIATLISIGLANRETRKIQDENMAQMNKNYADTLITYQINDAVELLKVLTNYMIKINYFYGEYAIDNISSFSNYKHELGELYSVITVKVNCIRDKELRGKLIKSCEDIIDDIVDILENNKDIKIFLSKKQHVKDTLNKLTHIIDDELIIYIDSLYEKKYSE